MPNKIYLSIIIASYNTRDITDICLTKLEKSAVFLKQKTGLDCEIIVVENASSDGSAQMIKKKHPGIKLIISKINLGFAKGNNLGLKNTSNPENILLLNSDVYVNDSVLFDVISYCKSHSNADVVGCRLNFSGGKLQPSAGFLPTPKNTLTWMLGLDKFPVAGRVSKPVHPDSEDFFFADKQVEWVMGAFMFMSRKVYNKTGGFDENFFMYMEEVEWCRRINQAGFEIWYTPSFSVTHLDKASSGFDLKKPLTKEIFGLKYYLQKYYPKSLWWLFPIIKTGMFLRYIGFLISGNIEKSGIYRHIFNSL